MSSAGTPIAGAGSNAEPVTPVEGLESEVSQPTEVQESQETPTLVEGAEDQQPKPGEEGQQPIKEDGRVIPAWMKALQTSNPEAYKKAKADLFELRDRRTVHATPQEARQEHDLIRSLGGAEGVATLREDATFFKSAAQQFLNGDPAFVKDLWEEDPIAAALHVAPMFESFKAKDLEGYKQFTAKLWDQEFQGVGFGNALRVIADAIKKGDKETASSWLNSMEDWYNDISNLAKKGEDPRVKTLLAERTRQREAQQQTQQQEFLKTYRTETTNQVVDEAAKVFDSFFKNRKLDEEDRNDLLREAIGIANRAVVADSSFVTQRDKHLQAGDAHSAQQLTKARYARELPEAVKRVARRYGLVSGAPGTPRPPNQQQQQAPPKVEAGFTAVNQRPEPELIDKGPGKTTPEMILEGRAILKDGKKVDWSALKKKGM